MLRRIHQPSEIRRATQTQKYVIVLRNVSEPPSRIFLSRIFLPLPLLEAIREIFRSRKFCNVRYISFSYELYVLYIRIFSYTHSPPLFNPKHDPPSLPYLPELTLACSPPSSPTTGLSSDQLQTTKPSPPTDGKVLRTALKCVEVRLRVCVFVH